jgi:hypothetical protein
MDPSFVPMEGPETVPTPPPTGSTLPALLAALGAGSSLLMPSTAVPKAVIAGLLGTLGAGAGQIGSQMAGSGGNFTTSDVLNRYGLPNNAATQILGDVAMDPLTYLGAAAGSTMLPKPGMSPERLGRFANQVGDAKGAMGPLAGSAPGLAPATMPPLMPVNPPLPSLPPLPQQATLGGYTAEQLGAIAGLPTGSALQIAPGQALDAARMYKRVNPEVGALLQELGFMDDAGALGHQLPPWAQVRGGRVMPTRGMEGMMPHLADLSGTSPQVDLPGAGGMDPLQWFGHDARMRMLQRLQGI